MRSQNDVARIVRIVQARLPCQKLDDRFVVILLHWPPKVILVM
jgi:hypothetical protein